MKSHLFIVFVLLSGILLTLQLTLQFAIETISIAGKLSTLSAPAAAWLGICTLTQYWWMTTC